MADEELLARAQSRVGTTLKGKYRIDRVLGIGGMAVVYAATHRNGRLVAIKMLHPELSLRTDLRMRFLREGHAANAVKHPGAVAVLDDDVAEDGAAFLVMEFLDGAAVEAIWERENRRLPLEVVVAIGEQVLDVLAAAHAAGVVHRDVKPANVFVTRDGAVKVLDFGIARLRDVAASQATQTGMMLGTPAYMAPEQALGRASDIDATTDLWAVGATLFTLASSRFVHEGDTPQTLLVRAATAPARSLAKVADAPPAVTRAIDRALAFDKSARWSSATEMRDALRSAYREAFGKEVSTAQLRALVLPAPDSSLASTLPQPGFAHGPTIQASDAVPTAPKPGSPPGNEWPLVPLIGATTAQPVSTADPSRGPPQVRSQAAVGDRSLTRRAAVAAGGVSLLVVIGVAVAAIRSPSSASPSSTAAGSAGDAAQAAYPAATAAPAPLASATSPIPEIAVSSLPLAPTTPSSVPPPVAKPVSPPPRTVPPPVVPTPVPPKPNCSTPYTVDSKGLKHWKVECL